MSRLISEAANSRGVGDGKRALAWESGEGGEEVCSSSVPVVPAVVVSQRLA